MDAKELINFLKTLRHFVPGYWKTRIEEVIRKMGGKVDG